jgi:hypothetical protein
MASHGPTHCMVLFTTLMRTSPRGEPFQKPACILEVTLSDAASSAVQARTRETGIVKLAAHDPQNLVLK